MKIRSLAPAAIFVLTLCGMPEGARGSASPAWDLSLGGSFRTVAALVDNFDEPLLFGSGNGHDGLSVSILRLTAEGERNRDLSFEAHLVQDLVLTSAGDSSGSAAVAGSGARYRAFDLSWQTLDGGEREGRLSLDRLNVRWSRGPVDFTLGRQAVSFSQAYFWNPLDIFLPFDPEAFDRSYKPGVDALRVDVALGPFSSLTIVAAAGNTFRLVPGATGFNVAKTDFADEPWDGSAVLARGRTTLSHWDVTLQGGKVSGGWQVGGGFSGGAGPLGIRGEATWLFAGEGDALAVPAPPGGEALGAVPIVEDYGRIVVGADHLFESSLYVNAEYFFNGAGEEEDLSPALARVAVGETTNLGRHFLGVQASYDIHPLLSGQVAWIHSLTDGSDLLNPTVRWSVADEAECIFGGIIGLGERPSVSAETGALEIAGEFGAASNLYFTELIFYF